MSDERPNDKAKQGTRRKKIVALSSGGGHWVQLLRLRPAFEGHDVVFATVNSGYQSDIPGETLRAVPDATRWSRLSMVRSAMAVFWLLVRERPDVVVSTGAAPGFFGVLFGRLLGAKTVWIDSIANAEELSLSGQKAGRYATFWLTQWEHLARPGGPEFHGSVL